MRYPALRPLGSGLALWIGIILIQSASREGGLVEQIARVVAFFFGLYAVIRMVQSLFREESDEDE